MKKTAAIIFSNIDDQQFPEMTKLRTIAALPIASRYRLIDFVLSGMSNAGVYQVGIVCKAKYHSLMTHVSAGKPWDLDRKNGGVSIISPFVEAGSGPLYQNRLEAMQNAFNYVSTLNAENIILTDSDLLANIPYRDILEAHTKSGADITAVYKQINIDGEMNNYNIDFDIDEHDNLQQVKTRRNSRVCGSMNHALNIYIIKRETLKEMLSESLIYGYRSFSRELLPLYLKKARVKAYKYKGYVCDIVDLKSFWQGNIDLLDSHVRDEIFNQKDLPVYTNTKDSPPTVYTEESHVSNSLISDGCIIAGTVENSVIFRGVRVDEGAVVRNSVLLTDSVIESGARLNYVVADRSMVVRKGRSVGGCAELPYFIPTLTIL